MRTGVARALGLLAAVPTALILILLSIPDSHSGIDPRSPEGVRHTVMLAVASFITGALSRSLPGAGAGFALRTIVAIIAGIGLWGLGDSAYRRNPEFYHPLVFALVMTPALILGSAIVVRLRGLRAQP